MLLKQTKIVASISDRRCDVGFLKQGLSYIALVVLELAM